MINRLFIDLKKNSDEKLAKWLKNYMRNQFEFLGVESKIRNKIFDEYWKKEKNYILNNYEHLIKKLFKDDFREMQYAAIFFFKKIKKQLKENDLKLIKFTIETKPWWDTVDLIAPDILANYLDKFPQKINVLKEHWINDKNLWVRRSCIILQLRKKEKTDFELLKFFILKQKEENEFFIQKAIGWALREYSKVNLQKVKDFLEKNNLSKIAEKEALRYAKQKNML